MANDDATKPSAPETLEDFRPFDHAEISKALRQPHRIPEMILTDVKRLIANFEKGEELGGLALILFLASIAFALPYGGVLDIGRSWRIVVLYLGSLLICLPSLQIFSAYVGYRMAPLHNLAMGLVITSVAALFTFGFFPILWFLRATMTDEPSQEMLSGINIFLLVVSLLAGVGHLIRCLQWIRRLDPTAPVLIAAWLALLFFITFRMADLLELV